MNIQTEVKNKIATITIDRPKALNALNLEVLTELKSELSKLKNISVVIFTGGGEKAFVAGADIAAMSAMKPEEAKKFSEFGQSVIQFIEEAPFISIAAVNGFALGGGLELALACDLIYASTSAKFGLPETNLGIIPGFGGTVNLIPRAGYARAMEMILTGRMISAEEAKTFGIALELFQPADLIPKVNEIAEKLSKKGKQSLLCAKYLVKANAFSEKEAAIKAERDGFARLFDSGEPKEGMTAFLEKREPQFK